MALCQHGYTSNWDCPLCKCAGCGRTQDGCICHLESQADRPREDSIDLEDALLMNLPHDA